MSEELSVVGKRLPRPDAFEKATGAAKYTVDIQLPGMLFGKILRSPLAHARIRKIDTSKAAGLPGVFAVITHDDIPPNKFSRSKGDVVIVDLEDAVLFDEYVINEKARFVGEPIAAVAAINEGVAEQAIALIGVEYEKLPAVFDPLEATKTGAPRIHESAPDNLALHLTFKEGDVEKGFAEADYIVEKTFYTSKQKLCHLEPTCCVANFDASGKLTIWSPGQHAFPFRKKIAEIFEIPEGMITWLTPNVGGAFGNGQSLRAEPICIALAKKAGRPVKLEYTCEEDFVATETRAPCIEKGRIGVKKDGTISALQLDVVANAGPYLTQNGKTTKVTMILFGALYRCANIYCTGDVIYTNSPVSGGLRGYGAPEAFFVLEQLVDMAAQKIGMDPLQFRKKNHRRTGDPSMYSLVSKGKKTSIPIESCELDECLRIGAEKIGWHHRNDRKSTGPVRRGVGMATYIYISSAFPVDRQHTNAVIKMNEDGSANLIVSACDFGQGILASLAQIAAEEIGISADEIHVVSGNTDITMFDTGQYSSRSVYVIGNTVLGAARQVKQKLLERAAKMLGVPLATLKVKNKLITSVAAPEKVISIAQVAREAIYNSEDYQNISATYSWKPTGNPNPFQAVFAEVEVDTVKGSVRLIKVVAAQDVGRAINPNTVEGQIQGGLVQSIGFALSEDYAIDPITGVLESCNYSNYKVPSTLDMPEIDIELVEQPTPTGPFGAKSVGESGTIAMAPAIYNAVYDAIGVRIDSMPITPEKILEGLKLKAPKS